MNKLEQVGKRVWYLPAHPDPNQVQPLVGVVVGDGETVLIDAGNTPRTAETVLSELERIGAPPVGKVIYTHHHWDHVFGGCVYGAEAIAHTLCRTQLETEALKPWSEAFLIKEVSRDPTLEGMVNVLKLGVEDWEEFRIVVPKVSFEATYVVQGEGYRLELEHVGGKHAADSVVVNVPDEGVMFLGDSFYPPPLRLELADKSLDMEMLKGFLAEDCEFYLDGHSEPFAKTDLAAWLGEDKA
jgi:glyoxylase-like metal-dependent hydrolase (beta-lactamase superfamily II)